VTVLFIAKLTYRRLGLHTYSFCEVCRCTRHRANP
jgi:hypothetical protein